MPYSNEAWKAVNSAARKKINVFGFKSGIIEDPNDFFHCITHKYARLLNIRNEIGVWQCPECGVRYLESDLVHKTKLQSKRSRHNKSIIGSLKTPKKYYDKVGNPINTNDKDIMKDLADGNIVKEYHEYVG